MKRSIIYQVVTCLIGFVLMVASCAPVALEAEETALPDEKEYLHPQQKRRKRNKW